MKVRIAALVVGLLALLGTAGTASALTPVGCSGDVSCGNKQAYVAAQTAYLRQPVVVPYWTVEYGTIWGWIACRHDAAGTVCYDV